MNRVSFSTLLMEQFKQGRKMNIYFQFLYLVVVEVQTVFFLGTGSMLQVIVFSSRKARVSLSCVSRTDSASLSNLSGTR